MDKKSQVLYVGKAKNLKKRVASYFVNRANLLEKTKILVSQIEKIRYFVTGSEIEALLLEVNFIKKHIPKYNARLRDGKRYPLIRITIKDKYPKVLIARRYEDDPTDKESLYFGPFPNSGAVHLVLKTIRRIFPFQSVIKHPKKPCLYYHLGLCPCPEVLMDKEYKNNISRIIDFLKGKSKKIIRELEHERNKLSAEEHFENAQSIQKQIDSIRYVTSPTFDKFDYKTNPNLESDLRINELTMLKKVLFKNGTRIKNLKRIECFDVSNISGTNSTGSMVVFVNGEKNTSEYRRFRIRNLPNFPASPPGGPNLPNDFAMMRQVISRRLNHPEWPYPDLIIVDGGKGQVSAASKALYSSSEQVKPDSREVSSENSSRPRLTQPRTISRIPIIGLAKREETIVTPNFEEIKLPKDSPALHLIQRIRDESHRFAITYHKKLRSKIFLS